MAHIIAADPAHLDWQRTTVHTEFIDQIDEAAERDATYMIPIAKADLEDERLLLPAAQLDLEKLTIGQRVYFDLEVYPFFQKIKDVMMTDNDRKGVCRLRRVIPDGIHHSWITTDLYVLSQVLGTPESVWIKRTDRDLDPYHVIATVNFGGGTMAHLDYTFSQKADKHLALEWSGMHTIVEFDSSATNPVYPAVSSIRPLAYSVDQLLDCAHEVDAAMLKTLTALHTDITGGDRS
ncbi:hypothetical protein [Lentibacillus saliphilus]|uniref:hypothetical protein n=1 Tax=Lentibacillus saliphilus TaxID=2737028 RepID=UPI001C306EC5|nr:hypothetical protein [Lentibacillus saliphilus]